MSQEHFDAEKLSYKGSRILTDWKAGREAARALGENATETGLSAEELYSRLTYGVDSFSGKAVNENTAMQVSAVYGAIQLVAGAISTMPIEVFERTEDGEQKVDDHDYWWLLNESANYEITASTMMTFMVGSLGFHGDSFTEILRPTVYSSKVVGFLPHHPRRVTPFRDSKSGILYYRISPADGGANYVLDAADMIHIPRLGFDGLRSVSPVSWAAKQNIGIALSAEEYSAKFFSNGATSQIALKTEGDLEPKQVKDLQAAFMAKNAGGNNYHMPIVLTNGLDVEELSINPEDAALIATRKFTVEELCRVLFNVPPVLLGHTDKSSMWGTGVEQLSIGFVKYSLRPLMNAIRQELNRKLWPFQKRYFLRFDTSEIERGDLRSTFEAYRVAIGRAGERSWMSADDVRQATRMPPIPEEKKGDYEPISKGSETNTTGEGDTDE